MRIIFQKKVACRKHVTRKGMGTQTLDINFNPRVLGLGLHPEFYQQFRLIWVLT